MDHGLDVEPMWEADLVEGAVADLAGTGKDIHDDFGGSTFDAELPDGTSIPDASGGLGDVVRGQVFSTAPDGTIKAQIIDALRSAQLKPISIKILRPLDAAPVVVASAADPTTAAKNLASIRNALFGNPAAYDGYYLELRDTSGTAFVRTSASYRTGAGRFWVEPSLADVASIKSFGRPPGDAPNNTDAQRSQK
jgi:hypothetical protein